MNLRSCRPITYSCYDECSDVCERAYDRFPMCNIREDTANFCFNEADNNCKYVCVKGYNRFPSSSPCEGRVSFCFSKANNTCRRDGPTDGMEHTWQCPRPGVYRRKPPNDCDCDEFQICPVGRSPLLVNCSAKCVTRPSPCPPPCPNPCPTAAGSYQYEIIDVQLCSDTAQLCRPPDPSMTPDKLKDSCRPVEQAPTCGQKESSTSSSVSSSSKECGESSTSKEDSNGGGSEECELEASSKQNSADNNVSSCGECENENGKESASSSGECELEKDKKSSSTTACDEASSSGSSKQDLPPCAAAASAAANACQETPKCVDNANVSCHRDRLAQFFMEQFCRRGYTDVAVLVDCTRFEAHKAVLACYSGYFADLLRNQDAHEVVLDRRLGISADTFRALLQYMYSGTLNADQCNVGQLLAASHLLQIQQLQCIAERMLDVLPLPPLPTTPGCCGQATPPCCTSGVSSELEKHWKRLARHFQSVWQSEEFLQLSGECVRYLLSRDDLTVCSELDLVKAAIRWINYDAVGRSAWTGRLFRCVNLKNLTTDQLITLTTDPDLGLSRCNFSKIVQQSCN